MNSPDPTLMALDQQVSISTNLLRKALGIAVRQTIENDQPKARKAWLTRHCVWALYPALYKDLSRLLAHQFLSTQLPDEDELLRLLVQSNLVARPRAVAVRETGSTCLSHLNIAIEIAPEHIWSDDELRPPLWYATYAAGPALRQVANLMGFPPNPSDLPRLVLSTLCPKPQLQPDPWEDSVNPHVVLAIYWQAQDLEPEEETRSIL